MALAYFCFSSELHVGKKVKLVLVEKMKEEKKRESKFEPI